MGEIGSKLHIDLYNQNIGKDDINISLIGNFKLPAIVACVKILRESDVHIIKNTMDLSVGEYYLYIQFNGQSLCIGKTNKTLKNYQLLTNVIDNIKLLEVIEDEENGGYKSTELTLDDMSCTVVLCTRHLEENPHLHIDFILEHSQDYLDIIYNNREEIYEFRDFYTNNGGLFERLEQKERLEKQKLEQSEEGTGN